MSSVKLHYSTQAYTGGGVIPPPIKDGVYFSISTPKSVSICPGSNVHAVKVCNLLLFESKYDFVTCYIQSIQQSMKITVIRTVFK